MKISAYHLSIDNLFYMDYHSIPLPFLHSDLELPHSMIFQKSQPHYKQDRRSYYEHTLRSICGHIYG